MKHWSSSHVLLRTPVLALCCAVAAVLPTTAQQRRARPAASAPAARPSAALKARADQAREAGNIDEAIPLYRKALAAEPNWAEGWWSLATLLYDRDQYAEAARAFKRAATLQPKIGAAWVMLGLCEFRLDDYDNALTHIRQGRQLGVGNNEELSRVMRYHEGLLLLIKGDPDMARNVFNKLSYENVNHEDLIIAHGLAALRLPMLPSQINKEYRDRDLIRRVGFAEHIAAQLNASDAEREYERAVADYPKAPGVQYAYGNFLLKQRNEEGAVAAFQKEIENSPNHALARLQIAYLKMRDKDYAAALKLAQEAVRFNAYLPLGHYILGRALFESGDAAKAIPELEAARKMAPNEARIYFILSRAYAKAGRKLEADQARETFTRLNQMAQEAAVKGNARGDALEETPEKRDPN